jgi:hypothetical protein
MSSESKSQGFFFHAWLMHMHQLVTFGELNNDVDTTGTGSMRVVASELQSVTAVCGFRKQYGRQPPTRKAFSSGTTN